jgi:hypothetical protein
MNAALSEIVAMAGVREKFAQNGPAPNPTSVEELRTIISNNLKNFAKIIDRMANYAVKHFAHE